MMENRIIENIKTKSRMKIAVSKFLEEEKIMPKRNLVKFVATFVLTIGATAGLVYAGNVVYEKIWKEPESYTYEEMINELPPPEVTEEEKKELITEEAAKKKGLEILKNLGYEKQTINRIELKRGYSEEVTSYYMVKTKWGYEEGLMIQLNANNGDFIAFNDMDLKYKHLQSQILTEEEISKIANDIYSRLGLKVGEYKLSQTKVEDHYFQNQSSKILGANFYKYYNDIKNKYESFNVSFMAVDNKILLNSILLNKDNTYQKNPLVITEEEAINIAKSKEGQFSSFEITNVTSNLSIEKMNSFIYQIENDKYDITHDMEEETYYKTQNIARKVWKVKLEHNVDVRNYAEDHNRYIKEGMSKIYFIDATTGEIIGGENSFRKE